MPIIFNNITSNNNIKLLLHLQKLDYKILNNDNTATGYFELDTIF